MILLRETFFAGYGFGADDVKVKEVQMKTVGALALIISLVCSVASVTAQEHFYDNGVYVGLGAQASIMRRAKKINYGFPGFCPAVDVCDPLIRPFSGTGIRDVAPSPTLTLGYKVNEANSISLTGDWARYSVSRGLVAPDAAGFTSFSVDDQQHVTVPPGNGPTLVDLDWKSDVYNLALEYQRRLSSGDLGGVLALLGFKLRHERQAFDARAFNATVVPSPVVDSYHERLNEYLFGPYGGLKVSFKPQADSRFNFNLKGTVGWYFKRAFFKGHNKFFDGERFSQDDEARDGTVFAGGGLNMTYAITKNWHLEAGYEFNWIHSAAHIFNTNVSKHGVPSRIIGSSIVTHTPGIKLIYNIN